MTQATRKRLGRGLAALIGDDTNEESVVQDARSLRHVPIEFLKSSTANPRKSFGAEEIEDLANSIRDKGLLQPLVVRRAQEPNYFEIVAGERRWRAAQRAGLHELPVLVRELNDAEMLEIALIENIQRTDLNPIEEATGYARLIEEFSYTQQQLAESIGKSRSHIANTLRLLNLPVSVRRQVEQGELSAGHARALVATDNPEALADRIIAGGLSVRQAEDLIRKPEKATASPNKNSGKTKASKKDADIQKAENELSALLGLNVKIIQKSGKESGQITIAYKTFEQFDLVYEKLKSPVR